MPAEVFERAVEGDNPPTVTRLADMGRRPAPRPVLDLMCVVLLMIDPSSQELGAPAISGRLNVTTPVDLSARLATNVYLLTKRAYSCKLAGTGGKRFDLS